MKDRKKIEVETNKETVGATYKVSDAEKLKSAHGVNIEEEVKKLLQ